MRKYLENIKDIEALKDTDTIIHYGSDEEFVLKFVNGVLCSFYKENTDHLHEYNFPLNIEIHTPYIEEPSKDCIGKLGWFYDYGKADDGFIDVLKEVEDGEYFPEYGDAGYQHFRSLTADEVEKYTTFKVMKEELKQ